MKVYFLRHGVAEDSSPDGTDASRRLTKRGTEEMEALGAWMARAGIRVDCIVTSPLVRAAQTASLVAEHLNLADRLLTDDRVASNMNVNLLGQLASLDRLDASLMVVGHEPSMSSTISSLIGGGEIIMKKGALALVEADVLEPGGGALVWLVTPRLLRGL